MSNKEHEVISGVAAPNGPDGAIRFKGRASIHEDGPLLKADAKLMPAVLQQRGLT